MYLKLSFGTKCFGDRFFYTKNRFRNIIEHISIFLISCESHHYFLNWVKLSVIDELLS